MAISDKIGDILKLGPSNQHTEAVKQSWFGTLLGQATAFILMVVAYLSAIGIVLKLFGDDFTNFQGVHPKIFIALLGFPLIFIMIFSGIPMMLRWLSERKIRPLASRDQSNEHGYFRLQPYEVEDAAHYYRPDDAVERALAWVERSEHPVLYLTGASGTGKSSLINAGMIPKLKAQNWRILLLRGKGTPLNVLRIALLDLDEFHAVSPPKDTDVMSLLTLIRRNENSQPLLIVMDQFEEFLILDNEGSGEDYISLLNKLSESPIPDVKILHVFRSDYRSFLFKQNLPDYVPRKSGFELAPFTRAEAEIFLKKGPRQLDDAGYEALFLGLDRIEDTRGIYRPITLNMIGFVLEREGKSLTSDPAQLIEQYLKDCISHGDTRDFSRQILGSMITPEGTKSIMSIEEIADFTALENWQIKATLTALSEDGLVRPLTISNWEISHDFLARQVGQILGRIKKPWVNRFGTVGLLLTGISWIVSIGLLVPYWHTITQRNAVEKIIALGFSRIKVEKGYGFKATQFTTNDDLAVLKAQISILNVTELDLYRATNISNLEALIGMPLTSLNLAFTRAITDLSPLEGMPLTSLNLSFNRKITDIGALKGMPLTSLDLTGTSSITDLDPLKGMPITSLNLIFNNGITDLSPLKGMPLNSLYLSYMDGITNLAPLKGMPLTFLDLSGTNGITDLDPLKGMPLTSLRLEKNRGITDLSPLKGMPLTSLDLRDADGITDLSPLKGMPLISLDLREADGIKDLSPLKGMDVSIFGVSDEIMATQNP